jgi:hypothetical protein
MTKIWLWLQAFYLRILTKLLANKIEKLENKLEKEEPVEDVILKIELLLKSDGDVYLDTTCFVFDEELVSLIATLFFLLNSGRLAELNIQSIKTWIEDDPEQADFINKILSVWHILHVQHNPEMSAEVDEPVVNPLAALEPDGK